MRRMRRMCLRKNFANFSVNGRENGKNKKEEGNNKRSRFEEIDFFGTNNFHGIRMYHSCLIM